MSDNNMPPRQPPSAGEPTGRGPWGQPAAGRPDQPVIDSAPNGEALPHGAQPSTLSLAGQAGDFLKLIIRGAWLQLFTFGFYRFWLTTDIRRYLWSHTIVDGDGGEYTGTARELLFGFLFALAILTPIYLLYFIGGVEAERAKAFASIPLGLFLVLLGQFAIYRARRYRLTRTIWRGVRFWMDGSGWNFAFRSFAWLILVFLTLGLLYPWRAASLERYKMRHTHYGNIQGDFEANGWDFFKKGVWLWLIALVPFVLVFAALVQVGIQAEKGWVAPAKIFAAITLASSGLIILPIIWPFFQALEWRWWASGVRIGDARLSSSVRGGAIFVLYLKLLFAVFIMSIAVSIAGGLLFAIAAAISQGLFDTSLTQLIAALAQSSPYVGVAIVILGYLILGLAFGVVQRYFLQYRYWALMVSNMEIHNVHALDGAKVEGELAGSLGEGLADGLDVGGF